MWICILFGVCFSISIAVLWEFFEFAMDTFLHTDMQKDSLIQSIYSYEVLGGELGTILNVEEVTTVINGEYVVNGYIDLGRMDSMLDLLVETLGAIAFAIVYAVDKGVHTSFHLLKKEEPKTLVLEEAEKVLSILAVSKLLFLFISFMASLYILTCISSIEEFIAPIKVSISSILELSLIYTM